MTTQFVIDTATIKLDSKNTAGSNRWIFYEGLDGGIINAYYEMHVDVNSYCIFGLVGFGLAFNQVLLSTQDLPGSWIGYQPATGLIFKRQNNGTIEQINTGLPSSNIVKILIIRGSEYFISFGVANTYSTPVSLSTLYNTIGDTLMPFVTNGSLVEISTCTLRTSALRITSAIPNGAVTIDEFSSDVDWIVTPPPPPQTQPA